MGVAEAESLEDVSGRVVSRMMPGVETGDSERRECMRDHGFRGFTAKALAPRRLAKLKSDLVDTGVWIVRLKATATDVFAGAQ